MHYSSPTYLYVLSGGGGNKCCMQKKSRQDFPAAFLLKKVLLIINKLSKLRCYGYLFNIGFFHAANDLCINTEAFRNSDQIGSNFPWYIQFHAVAHIKHLVHFLPAGF